MHLSTLFLADYALVAKLVCSDGPTAQGGALGFLASLFRGRIHYLCSQKYKAIPWQVEYIYIYYQFAILIFYYNVKQYEFDK